MHLLAASSSFLSCSVKPIRIRPFPLRPAKPAFVKFTSNFHLLNPVTCQHCLTLEILSPCPDAALSWFCSKLLAAPSRAPPNTSPLQPLDTAVPRAQPVRFSVDNHPFLSISSLMALCTPYAEDHRTTTSASALSPESLASDTQTASSRSLLGCQLYILNVHDRWSTSNFPLKPSVAITQPPSNPCSVSVDASSSFQLLRPKTLAANLPPPSQQEIPKALSARKIRDPITFTISTAVRLVQALASLILVILIDSRVVSLPHTLIGFSQQSGQGDPYKIQRQLVSVLWAKASPALLREKPPSSDGERPRGRHRPPRRPRSRLSCSYPSPTPPWPSLTGPCAGTRGLRCASHSGPSS